MIPDQLRRAQAAAAKDRTAQRQARQVKEGIPAEWDRTKAHNFRKYRDRCQELGLDTVDALAWGRGERELKPGRPHHRPAGWCRTEWKAYKSLKNFRKKHGQPDISPEDYQANHAKVPPEVYQAAEVSAAERAAKRKATVDRILREAEQSTRRRRP